MKKPFISLALLLCTYFLFAQQTYTVKVIDSKTGSPMLGATVKLKASRGGSTTNSDGNCSIQGKENDILEISNVGYRPQSVKLGSQATITVAMEPLLIDGGAVVV